MYSEGFMASSGAVLFPAKSDRPNICHVFLDMANVLRKSLPKDSGIIDAEISSSADVINRMFQIVSYWKAVGATSKEVLQRADDKNLASQCCYEILDLLRTCEVGDTLVLGRMNLVNLLLFCREFRVLINWDYKKDGGRDNLFSRALSIYPEITEIVVRSMDSNMARNISDNANVIVGVKNLELLSRLQKNPLFSNLISNVLSLLAASDDSRAGERFAVDIIKGLSHSSWDFMDFISEPMNSEKIAAIFARINLASDKERRAVVLAIVESGDLKLLEKFESNKCYNRLFEDVFSEFVGLGKTDLAIVMINDYDVEMLRGAVGAIAKLKVMLEDKKASSDLSIIETMFAGCKWQDEITKEVVEHRRNIEMQCQAIDLSLEIYDSLSGTDSAVTSPMGFSSVVVSSNPTTPKYTVDDGGEVEHKVEDVAAACGAGGGDDDEDEFDKDVSLVLPPQDRRKGIYRPNIAIPARAEGDGFGLSRRHGIYAAPGGGTPMVREDSRAMARADNAMKVAQGLMKKIGGPTGSSPSKARTQGALMGGDGNSVA